MLFIFVACLRGDPEAAGCSIGRLNENTFRESGISLNPSRLLLPLGVTPCFFGRPGEVGRNNSVIETIRLSFPLHESAGGAVIEDFHPGALQHFYLCNFSGRSIDR